MQNHSYENEFDLHENETACRTHFHKNGFALRLALKQRHKGTRKWPIQYTMSKWLVKCLNFCLFPLLARITESQNASKLQSLLESQNVWK